MKHKFTRSNAFSREHDAFWTCAYERAFPGLLGCHAIDGAEAQRAGIDRVLVLDSGHVIRVDEKTRSKPYNDVLLEVISDDARDAPGWIEKSLLIDYLAYGFPADGRAWFFPWQDVRRAWREHGETWKRQAAQRVDGFDRIRADNLERGRRWTTCCIVVPRAVFVDAIAAGFEVVTAHASSPC